MSKPKTSPKKDPVEPKPAPEAEAEPLVATVTRETLEDTVPRALSFVRATGTVPAIRALMGTCGYTAAVHQEGWDLIHATSGYVPGEALPTVDVAVRDAIATLDAQDEDIFRIVGATLRRHHPAAAAYVLAGIGASTGAAAVVGVKTLLMRLDALENDPKRAATRVADHAALATLAERSFHAQRRAELAAFVATAESTNDTPNDSEDVRVAADEAYEQKLVALRAWYEEWSDIARSVVKRRDHLIRMGLAKRKAPEKKGKGDEPKPK